MTLPATSSALLHDFVRHHARQNPSAPAGWCGGERITYGELDARANALARRLRQAGVKPGVTVGVSQARGLHALVSLVAALKAGGAYVPLDPAYPAERVDFMVRDIAARVVLADGSSLSALSRLEGTEVICVDDWRALPQDDNQPASGARPDDLCYVIYTSGSTGRPKGSMNCHAGVVNTLRGLVDVLEVDASFRVGWISSLNYDMSVFEIFGTWVAGGCVVVPMPDEVNDPDRLTRMIAEAGVNLWSSAPPLFGLVVKRAQDSGQRLPEALRVVILGGDRFPPRLVSALGEVAPWVAPYNLAGMTEVSYCSTWYRVCPEDAARSSIPWGRALANQRLHVVDDQLRPVPAGTPGELCIVGQGVGLGYWRRPELTAERFVADPFDPAPGARMYRTGDLVRELPGGDIELIGRLDQQIKVRGLRVEPGEIEVAVADHPAVQDCVVILVERREGDPELVAFVTARTGMEPPVGELRDFVRRRLPEHMVPVRFRVLPTLPLLPSGKIDRARLAAQDGAAVEAAPSVAARDELEHLLIELYGQLIGPIGVTDNFFDAGGNSLRATEYVAELRDLLGVRLPIRALFSAPTISEFARVLAAAGVEQKVDIQAVAASARSRRRGEARA